MEKKKEQKCCDLIWKGGAMSQQLRWGLQLESLIKPHKRAEDEASTKADMKG